jgi:hypothetical protein
MWAQNKCFIKENIDLLAKAMENTCHKNLRTFFFICDLFLDVHKKITNDSQKEYTEITLIELFQSLLIMAIEYKMENGDSIETKLKGI